MSGRRTGCRICDELTIGDLSELDLLMGDASCWPETVWGIFDKPKGEIPASYQRFGAVRVGRAWLTAHGYPESRFSQQALRQHYRFDVVVIASDPIELLNKGLIATADARTARLPPEKIDPQAFLVYFDRGIKLGNKGLELLAERIETMISKGEDVPLSLLKTIADIGGKLATTQASLRQRGLRMGDDDDADEGFRAGSVDGGIPSPKMGHARIRTVDGVTRPVADEGPADREHYSRRAREEGGEGLPH